MHAKTAVTVDIIYVYSWLCSQTVASYTGQFRIYTLAKYIGLLNYQLVT